MTYSVAIAIPSLRSLQHPEFRKSRTNCTLGLRSSGCFRVMHPFNEVSKNCTKHRLRRNSSKYNTPSFRTRRHFSHHSYRGISLQDCPSLAGATFGTRIDKYRSLVMSLVRRQKEQHLSAHLYYPSSLALKGSSPCDSNSE